MKKKPNDIMPSEAFLMQKFSISRITAINAYKKLESIGAVYNISKQGRFVAENFFGLLKPFASAMPVTSTKIKKENSQTPKWFSKFKIIFDHGFKKFKKEYLKDDEIIIVSENYISKKYQIPEKFEDKFSFTNFFLEKGIDLKNTIYKLQYEKVNLWNHEYLVVVYSWTYDDEGIQLASKYIVKPEYFSFSHQEKSLF
ncbi:GntR family transcriptional regulator [Mycoplasmopsis pulmonis]|uniref:GntR family transcriptional regulator n=1 Tax=Mycoplasmopsis pulmonis TaxID=2107 RepID=UPI002852D618|nr:GntR family transcriptional regulator [Mycoplasmopsis pulmonis]